VKSILRFSLILVILTCMFGCAFFEPEVSSEYYKDAMETWIGLDINRLISQWGPPSDVFVMPNENKMYTWLETSGSVVVTNYNYWLNQSVSGTVSNWCKTTIEANTAGIIIHARWEGNNCVHRRVKK
jgi:hypothetical protein